MAFVQGILRWEEHSPIPKSELIRFKIGHIHCVWYSVKLKAVCKFGSDLLLDCLTQHKNNDIVWKRVKMEKHLAMPRKRHIKIAG